WEGEWSGWRGPVMVVRHKPLFLQSADEAETTASSVNPAPRARLLDRLSRAPVRVVVSGHLHCHRDVVREGRRHVWAPSTAFLLHAHADAGSVATVGILSVELDGPGAGIKGLAAPALVAYARPDLKGNAR